MAVLVTHEPVHDANRIEIEPAKWRVAVDVEGQYLALPMDFGRQEDAERARDALESAGLTNPKALHQAGKKASLATMLGALAW